MIRIDEIYNNTFWTWIQQNRPGTRMFYCDPFGHTDCEHLFNLGPTTTQDNDYVFFHDQEPVDLSLYQQLFDTVLKRNHDIASAPQGHVIVSEKGQLVQQLQDQYGWQVHYYFFHGWACLDWYRGYDKTFLIPRAAVRTPNKTFISPNRIIAGKRDHRVLFLYHIFKNKLDHNWISAPKICVHEKQHISSVASKYNNTYHDIEQVLEQANLPRLFTGEQEQIMSSCWLTNFSEAADSLLYVATETVYFGSRLHLTEKTFKAIALEMPFVLVAPAGSLAYLREYGFKTFASVFDESYDDEQDDIKRLEKICQLLKHLDSLTLGQRLDLHRACLPIVQHNYNHFYRGGFSDVLWDELTGMLHALNV